MDRLKTYLLVLVGLIILSTVQWTPRIEAQGPPQRPRGFYLTPALHNGGTALSACARGYHMASLWEILDPSNLRYDTDLGVALADSGSGPPSGFRGWIRTGTFAGGGSEASFANCSAWQSQDPADSGAAVSLSPFSNEPGTLISPWNVIAFSCTTTIGVWCVQD
jgi:hypothetical protein